LLLQVKPRPKHPRGPWLGSRPLTRWPSKRAQPEAAVLHLVQQLRLQLGCMPRARP
jgi:hypothetical protein